MIHRNIYSDSHPVIDQPVEAADFNAGRRMGRSAAMGRLHGDVSNGARYSRSPAPPVRIPPGSGLGYLRRHGDPVHPSGKPNQNAYVQRFTRIFREAVLDHHLLARIDDVRETAWWWMIEYNEQRPHYSLGDLTPSEYRQYFAGSSTCEVPA